MQMSYVASTPQLGHEGHHIALGYTYMEQMFIFEDELQDYSRGVSKRRMRSNEPTHHT